MIGEFNPTYSTNNIWIDEEMDQCLTLLLESIQASILSKADATHTHSGYAPQSALTLLENMIATKANANHTHTEYAPVSHDHSYNDLSDKPTIPSIEGLATTTYVDSAVSSIVDTAPEALNTLNELAAALGDDANFATTIATQLGNKVDKVNGKELSSNDYTNAEKTKLAGIAAGANNYSLPAATQSALGGIKIGNNITNNSGQISLTRENVTSALGYTPFNSNSVVPVTKGGTGKTVAWTNGTVSSMNNTTISSCQFAVFPYLNKAFIRLNVLLGSTLVADGAAYIAMPSTVSTAHTALSCYNHSGYDIHCGMSSDSGIYVINCGTSDMPTNVRLYIAGWFSI